MRAICPAHLVLIDLIILIMFHAHLKYINKYKIKKHNKTINYNGKLNMMM
jgi:hypothetical protein